MTPASKPHAATRSSRWHRLVAPVRKAIRERHPLVFAISGVALLHIIGFGLMFAVIIPGDLHLSSGKVFGVGLCLTAYTLGMRHAFDADHIAAIDNTSRKLLQEGKRPHAAGFFFSAGHSTVVLLLAVLVAIGVRGIGGEVGNEHSTLMKATGIWGPTVAGTFLLLVGFVNLAVLRGSLRLMRKQRAGELELEELDRQLAGTGVLNRATRKLSSRISKPWHLYPLGFMFGLGFDTATEIALLVLAGGGAASGVPVLAILALPILFAAGMTALDTANGATMTKAYSWALNKPERRLAYNTIVTGVSVLFAFVIGGLSLIGVVVEELGIQSGPLAALASIDVGQLGFLLLALILGAWTVAAIWFKVQASRVPGSSGLG